MTWTAPMTFVSNTVLTAAQLNIFLRDNFLECAPAKATTSGYHFVSTGGNAIAERAILSSIINTSESTTSTSYVDLASVGPQVTVTTGSKALWIASANALNGTLNSQVLASVAISGASSIASSNQRSLSCDGLAASQGIQSSFSYLESGLTPGVNTFTMEYRVDSNTGYFSNRNLIVIAL